MIPVKKILFYALLFMLNIGTALFAEVPRQISYQGLLMDTSGRVQPDGAYTLTFSLYTAESGGEAIWSETKTLQSRRGIFSTNLGDVNPFDEFVAFDSQYWLNLALEGESFPARVPLNSVGYSIHSSSASSALTVAEGSINTASISDGAVMAGKIADGAITQEKLADGLIIPLSGVAGGDLAGEYPNPLIASAAVTSAKLAFNAVLGEHILDGSVILQDLSENSVNSTRIIDGTIQNADIANGAVTSGKIADGAVAPSNMNPQGASGGDVLTFDGEQVLWSAPAVLAPKNPLSSIEMLNEAGVAAASAGSERITLTRGVQTLLARTITAPADGYLLAIASLQTAIEHRTGLPAACDFGVSDNADVLPDNQDVRLSLATELPAGEYDLPVTVHGLFAVPAGTRTYYFLADQSSGSITAHDLQFTLLYLPTAYGVVNANESASDRQTADAAAAEYQPPSIAGEQNAGKRFNAQRLESELERMQSEINSLKRVIREGL